MVTTSVLQMHF